MSSEYPLGTGIKDKLALFCNVPANHVLQNLDVEYLYEAPLAMEKENLAKVACEALTFSLPRTRFKRLERNGELSAKSKHRSNRRTCRKIHTAS